MKLKHSILFLLLLCANLLSAQDVKLTASVNSNKVGTGEQFEVTFSVNGNISNFTQPEFGGFQVLSGPNQSTSMTSINGSTTVSTAFSYILMGAKIGQFIIGPASAVVNGKRLTSAPIKMDVVKGQPVPQNSQGQSNQTQTTPDDLSKGKPTDIAKSLFIREVPDKTSVYQGQQLTLSFRVYTRVSIGQNAVTSLPDLNGFWNEDVKPNPQLRNETYKGIQYKSADVKQSILFPEHSGDLKIDPFGMAFIVQEAAPAKTVMEQVFGGSYQNVKYELKSPPLVIHVKPLPEAGKPESFTGAVGNFTVEASIDKTELKTNEAINYKVTVKGSGNIKLLKTLSTNFPADFEKYDPKISDTVTTGENGVSGSRFYNYLLIPRHQGDYTIEPLKFSYFNPATGKYYTVTTKAFHIKVNRGANEANVTALAGDKQDIKMLDKDIRYIKSTDGNLSKEADAFYGSVGYWLLLIMGPVLCLAAFGYRNWLRKTNSDLVKVKSRKAGRVAAKHLANAKQQLAANNTAAFYEAIFKGLYGYLSDKLNISYANLDRETIASALRKRALDGQVINRLLDTLDLCEMARYAPVTHISTNEVFEKAKGIINDIESKI
jgi:hypothetical protein